MILAEPCGVIAFVIMTAETPRDSLSKTSRLSSSGRRIASHRIDGRGRPPLPSHTTLIDFGLLVCIKPELGTINLCFKTCSELKTTYRPDIWIHNGPGAITRVLTKFCKTRQASEWSFSSCKGSLYKLLLI